MQVNLLLLTPLAIERKAVANHINGLKFKRIGDIDCYVGQFVGLFCCYNVHLIQTGSQNTVVALAMEKAIRQFNPSLALLAGVAGGVKDVRRGDIVVAKKAYNLDLGKETPEGFAARPEPLPYSREILSVAERVGDEGHWIQRISPSTDQTSSNIYLGPIASSDKVIASTHSELYHRIKLHFEDTLAVEMESAGFTSAAVHHPQLRYGNIRCISDILDDKSSSDKGGYQTVAAHRAAAFLFEVLYHLDCSKFVSDNIDIKTVAKELYKLFFPAALEGVPKNFTHAPNEDLRAFWKKLKPTFLEEDFEELMKDPEDSAARGVIEMKLRKALEQDSNLLATSLNLLDIVNKDSKNRTVIIQQKKNFIQGDNIRANVINIGDNNKNK